MFHKKVREQRKAWEDGGEVQRLIHETAEREARRAAQSGNVRCADGRRRAVRLQGGLAQISQGQPRGYRPESRAYYGLGAVLANSGHNVEAAERFLEAMERSLVGSEGWAKSKSKAKEHTPVDSEFWAEATRQKPSTCCCRRSAAR